MADHFVIFPMDENGVLWDAEHVTKALNDAMIDPFVFGDVFIYSHGWWTVANQAMVQYGQYSIEFTKTLMQKYAKYELPPSSSFGFGLHWPSTVSEDMGNAFNEFGQLFSYYKMGRRAEDVGRSGVYALLAMMFKSRFAVAAAGAPPVPFKLHLIGHSFGCRVVCSALQKFILELRKLPANNPFRKFVEDSQINVVLLQAAFKNTELESQGNYEALSSFGKLRMLITTSQLDKGLNSWFSKAEVQNNTNVILSEILNLLPINYPGAVALGAGMPPLQPVPHTAAYQTEVPDGGRSGGPTRDTFTAFGVAPPAHPVPVGPGYALGSVPKARLVVADLTPIHRANLENKKYRWDHFGGSHSDISCPEIYDLIGDFSLRKEARDMKTASEIEVLARPEDSNWFDTGFILRAGQTYTLTASGSWFDDDIDCGPSGYKLTDKLPEWKWPFFRLVEGLRPLNTGDQWFQLVGKVGNSVFLIGTATSFTSHEDAVLFCSPNDCPFAFWNNSGQLKLTITQTSS